MATLSASFTAVGVGSTVSMRHLDYLDYSVSGTFSATVQLQKSVTAGASWVVVESFTAAASGNLKVENKDQGMALYRFVCSAFTSGTAVTTLSDNTTASVLEEFKNSEDKVVFQITENGAAAQALSVTGALTAGSISNSGVTGFADGTVSAPGAAFSADTNTGFYRVAADTIGIATGGSERARYDTTGFRTGGTGTTVVFNNERVSVTYPTGVPTNDNAVSCAASLTQNADTAITTSIRQYGAYARFRRTITTSLTDTAGHSACGSVENLFTVSAAQTYTNTSTEGVSGFLVNAPLLTGGGAVAITHFHGMFVLGNSFASGTNKYGIRVGNLSGATNNYSIHTGTGVVSLGDALQMRNATAPSAVNDTVQMVSEDLSAGNTIPSLVCEGTGVVGAGITNTTVTHKVAVKVNGTVYYLLATTNGT